MGEAVIELDGSFGEGGGQILRTSLALSLVTGRPFHLRNIRARRTKPGLQPQHLMCVKAAAAVGQAQLRGAAKGSADLVFEPGAVVPGKYHFAIGTAGSTSLVLHTLYLPLALCAGAESEVVISGGTHNDHAPSYDFLEATWRAYLEVIGLKVKLQMTRPGFYPRGGGAIRAAIRPAAKLRNLTLREMAAPTKLRGRSVVANLPADIAARQAKHAARHLRSDAPGLNVHIDEAEWQSDSPGTVISLELNTAPAPTLFFALGARGKKAERVADEAVEQVTDFLAAEPLGVDLHSADQIVLPLALAEGRSAVIQKFVERRIVCEGEEGQPGIVRIE
jgi:RNA 3'-terminal phosphate cyclase (ATP)